MDYQNRPGAKTGSGGVASWSETNKDRRERLRQLALETIDLTKDPYFMKNHLGSYECKLCLTLHNNEGSYLAHTQGKKHQHNLGRRAAKEAKDALAQQQLQPNMVLSDPKFGTNLAPSTKKKFVKIGRPGYKVTKQKDPETSQCSLLFQIDYPEIAENVAPRHRFMSAYEQRMEPPDKKWQYLLFAAEPYETISFKVPSKEIDKPAGSGASGYNYGVGGTGYGMIDLKGGKGTGNSFVNYVDKKFWYFWNAQAKQFYLQFAFKLENVPRGGSAFPTTKISPAPNNATGVLEQLQPFDGEGGGEEGSADAVTPASQGIGNSTGGASATQMFPPPPPPNMTATHPTASEFEAPTMPGTLITPLPMPSTLIPDIPPAESQNN